MKTFLGLRFCDLRFQIFDISQIRRVSGKYLYRLKQIDFNGTFEYSNEVEVIINAPEKFELSQNYPNPFNPGTKIRYQITASSPVSLKIYDVLGREIKVLVNDIMTPGKHTVKFDGTGLSSGIYFYKITAGNYSDIKRMLLIK